MTQTRYLSDDIFTAARGMTSTSSNCSIMMSALVDIKGTIYEELLARSAQESSRGAGQYFTPRPVVQTMCEVMQPTPEDRICDPAAGTGGFLCKAYQYVLDRYERDLDRDEKRALQSELVEGMELSPKVGRICAMNIYLHGIGRTTR